MSSVSFRCSLCFSVEVIGRTFFVSRDLIDCFLRFIYRISSGHSMFSCDSLSIYFNPFSMFLFYSSIYFSISDNFSWVILMTSTSYVFNLTF